VEALAADEELAATLPDAPAEPVERWSEWSPERETLTVVADRLGELIRVSVAAAGGKPPQSRLLPRPRTALDRVRTRSRWRQHERLVAKLLPDKAGMT
jgi:hypothetical protein